MDIQQQAVQHLNQIAIDPALRTAIIALVATIPPTWEEIPRCQLCNSTLCGACGDCHSLDLHPGDALCSSDQDTSGLHCALWFQAYLAVKSAIQQAEDEATP